LIAGLTAWHFAKKFAALKLAKPWMLRTSPHREVSATMVRPRDHKAWEKIGEASLAGFTKGKTAQRSTKARWRDYISDLAWYLLMLSHQKNQRLLKTVRYFRVLLGLLGWKARVCYASMVSLSRLPEDVCAAEIERPACYFKSGILSAAETSHGWANFNYGKYMKSHIAQPFLSNWFKFTQVKFKKYFLCLCTLNATLMAW